MGDHFWPAVYPGIAVGLLYGLSLGGTRNIVLASLGALAAAFLSFTLMVPFFTEEGIAPAGRPARHLFCRRIRRRPGRRQDRDGTIRRPPLTDAIDGCAPSIVPLPSPSGWRDLRRRRRHTSCPSP